MEKKQDLVFKFQNELIELDYTNHYCERLMILLNMVHCSN